MPADNYKQSAGPAAGLDEATVISRNPSGLSAEVSGEVVMMNIEPRCSFATLIDRLVADYDADRATIAADVQTLLGRVAAEIW
jgi:hypothetical protein